MTATLRHLLRRPDLGLRLLVPEDGAESLDRVIRWVATSELLDPTPYLHGGELLLTNGIGLPKTRRALDRYVGRLIAAGVVGLGFGEGTVHAAVPLPLIASARAQGLPLVAVDEPTPFIAVGKAVSDLLAKEQYGEIAAAYEAQQQITRAALRHGAAGVVSRLATATGGWVVLLDPHGDVVEASRQPSSTEQAAWLPDLERLRTKGPATATTVEGREHRTVQSLSASGRVRGYLITGQESPSLQSQRALVNVAAALLTFSLAHEGGARDRLARVALMELASRHPDKVAPVLADLAGQVFDGDEVAVVAATAGDSQLEAWHQQLEDEGRSHCFPWAIAEGGGAPATVLVAVSDPVEMTRILTMARPDITIGVSDRLPKTRLATARDQALRGLEVARSRRVASLAFGELAKLGLTGVVEAGAAAAFAVATLEKLTAYEQTSKVDLRESIRVWLAHHGQYEPAAAVLGVHRHTLRYRVRKAAELLGRDLDDPSARMDLWFALTVHSGQG